MKKIKLLLAISLFCLGSTVAHAQGFGGQGSKYIQLGFGVNQHVSFYSDYNTSYNNMYGAFNLQMEFGVHKYVGVGFSIGTELAMRNAGYYHNWNSAWGYYGPAYSPYTHIGLPVGFFANFHFLQLIADKNGKNFADKMDVYGGLNIGSGVVFRTVKNAYKNDYYWDNGHKYNYYSSAVGALFFAGPHVGFRYFPTEKFGVYVEAGYGKNLVNGGVMFKL
jgi:hypothetical protein